MSKAFAGPGAADPAPARPAFQRLGVLFGRRAGPAPAASDALSTHGVPLPNRYHAERSRGVQALRGVDLFVPPGQTLSVLGPSGCGKTTLLRIVAGLEQPDAGKVFYDDVDVTAWPPAERGIGMVFQDYALYPDMEGKGNLAFYFRMHHREEEIEERVRVTSAMMGVGFAELLDKKPPVLSRGQQQRVAIGRCIVRDPFVFLFDEPMSNVDARVREQTRGVVKRLLHRFSVTSLYVTHDQTEAIALGDLLAIMREGRIEQTGTFADIYYHPVNRFVAGFLGMPPMSFFDGVRAGEGMRLPTGQHVPLPVPLASLVPEGAPLTLGVRAEHVSLAIPVNGAGLLGVVEVVEVLPSEKYKLAHMRVGGVQCQAQVPRDLALKPGYVMRLEFDPSGLFLFDAGEKTIA
ncbi:MAG: ABC transporter ATP-binding protein [Chloroflexota bacterium]